MVLCASTSGKTIYVDDNAAGANDGTSWENAYTYLQDALADANSAAKPVEILVAQGIYTPDKGATQSPGDKLASFKLINGVTLKGGFAGLIEQDPNQWNVEIYKTILSGDLNSDDERVVDPNNMFNDISRSEDAYNVVNFSFVDKTAVLNGFTVSGGHYNSVSTDGPPIGGAGIYIYSGNPKIINCTINDNSAVQAGGGICNISSSPTLINCIITGNYASLGAGMHNTYSLLIYPRQYSNPILINCTVTSNYANNGGGIYIEVGNTTLTNCIFSDNFSYSGAGNEIWNGYKSTVAINYCDIQGGLLDVYDPNGRLVWGEGSIDEDPLFADPNNGDYHLKSEAGRWDPVSESWVVDDVTSPCIDAGDPNSAIGDEPEPNCGRINMGAYGGTAEASMSPVGAEQIVYIQWLGHASVKVWTDDCIVYVDPQRLNITPHDATLVCVTHAHSDHYSPSDIARVSNAGTQFIAPPDVVSQYGSGQTIAPGQTIEFDFVNIKAVPAYNINKTNHPKSNNWVGYIIELGGKRIYVAGDTDLIEEMKSLGDIDVAFLPAGGTYSMNATEAAEATGYIKPDLAIPYHWGQIVGTLADAQRFVELARCPAMVMAVGETISSDNWPEYSPLVAHWALDEAEGDIAHDSAGDNHGTLYNEPAWQPAGGKIDGALQFDGVDDYVSTGFVLDPANGPFSVFAWIKGGAAGQTVISQADGTGSGETWLGADPLLGKLMTGLVPPPAGRFVPQQLVSEFVITDGQWHHIGFAWDGSYRILYVDGTEVAKDSAAQNPMKSADGGLYIGTGKTLEPSTFFSGLIDDIRIYNLALSVDEIAALAK
jgi:L-ascorbate metabolism protein UlaG (beta-lactamase superfamily)